jgi:carbon-monoxide dehydrogenase large subunit
MRVGGTAAVMGVDRLVETGRLLAAEMLEATPTDLHYAQGHYVITGTDRRVSLFQVAGRAEERGETLSAQADFEQQRESYSSGCHVCEVELDPDTGRVSIQSHVMVTDVGCALNPMLVDGQVHGGAAQGLGQAAMEQVVYDGDTGQTLTGSLMDYTLPRADDFPRFHTATAETRETDNPLGVKGVGEGPTTGSPAAFMNAVRDAVASAGGGDVQMPATPLAVWRALQRATQD